MSSNRDESFTGAVVAPVCAILGGGMLLVGNPLGFGLLGLSAVAARSARNRRERDAQESAIRDELIAACTEENRAIAELWRTNRRPGERHLKIERVVEESGAFGVARQRVVSRDRFEA